MKRKPKLPRTPKRPKAPKVPKVPKPKAPKKVVPKRKRGPGPPTPTPVPTPAGQWPPPTATPPPLQGGWYYVPPTPTPRAPGPLLSPPTPAPTRTPTATLPPHPWETPHPWPTLEPPRVMTPQPTYPPGPTRPWPTETHEPVWPEPGSPVPTPEQPGFLEWYAYAQKLMLRETRQLFHKVIWESLGDPPLPRGAPIPLPVSRTDWLPQPTPRPSYGEMEAAWAWPPQRLTLAQREAAEWERYREAVEARKALGPAEEAKQERIAELQRLIEELRAELWGLEYRKPVGPPGEPGAPGPWVPPEP